MSKYKQIISLGHFCSPAMEFERIDRRKFSLPFDWLITPKFIDVIALINNQFEDFLNEDYMYQMEKYPQYYRNVKWNIDFYHDFIPIKSFASQIGKVKDKYSRRISRFYRVIEEPTLFLRYITENDVPYILANHAEIIKTVKRFHPENEIILVANSNISLSVSDLAVFYVEKDAEDGVSRRFLDSNEELKKYILDNVEYSAPKLPTKKQSLFKKIKKAYIKIRRKLGIVYRHNKQC